MIDKIISHYKIISQLGQGGMGVLYLAEDLELNRKAVLKFLPPDMINDPEINLRFKREAQSAGSLSHPNIVTIYDVGVHENKTFIAMEYVEGKTLRELISSDELTIERITDISVQICDGLNEAHSKGITHRDIKPENILIDEKGKVKIVDFGLAKIKNVSRGITKQDSTVGTLKYMSPEQIRNQSVDHRSDIWSFGVILYEMITGKYPFKGEHDASIFYSVINQSPEPLARYKSNISEGFQRIIDKSLDKDPETRYHHIDELLSDIRRDKKSANPFVIIKLKKNNKKKFLWIGLLITGIIGLITYYTFFNSQSLQINPNMRTYELALSYTKILYPSMSSDGNWIALPVGGQNNKWDIYLMHTSMKELRRITYDSTHVIIPDISPDGSQILYMINDEIQIISSLGGVRKRITENHVDIKVQWHPDGNHIGFIRDYYPNKESTSFWSMNPDGSDAHPIFTEKNVSGITRIGFSYSPDGNSVAWIRNYGGGYQEVITKELKTGDEKQLTFDKKTIDEVEWTNKGVILFSSSKGGNMNIWMIPETGGEAVQVTKGNGPDMGIQFSPDPDKILYFQLTDFSHIWLGNLKSSKFRQLTFDERLICEPAFSPDGTLLAFTVYNPSSELSPDNQIYIIDRDGNNQRKITSGYFRHSNSRFSPDGKFLAFTQAPVSEEEGKGSVFIVDLKSPEKPMFISPGMVEFWANNNSLVVNRGHYTEITSIDGTHSKRISKDSTLAFPVASGKLMFYLDLHTKTLGKAFVTSPDDKKLDSPLYTYTFSDIDTFQTIVNRAFTENYFYWLNKNSEVWRLHFISGKIEKVGNFPNSANLWGLGFTISYDDKEILYLEYNHRGKLVMIEDPFIN